MLLTNKLVSRKKNAFRTFAGFDDKKVLSDSHSIFFCSKKLDNRSRLRGIHRYVNL